MQMAIVPRGLQMAVAYQVAHVANIFQSSQQGIEVKCGIIVRIIFSAIIS